MIWLTIKDGDFIKINYTGRFEDGTIFDTTDEEIAKEHGIHSDDVRYGTYVIIVGSGHVVKGFDEDFVGKDDGYHGTVVVPSDKGYGEHKPELVKMYPMSKFKEKPMKDMQVFIDGEQGTVVMTIGRRARVDFNSPMAGRTLKFEYTIEDIIDDDRDKIGSLLRSYFMRDFDVDITDGNAVVEAPLDLWLNRQWLLSKQRIAHELLRSMELDSVRFVETYSDLDSDSEP